MILKQATILLKNLSIVGRTLNGFQQAQAGPLMSARGFFADSGRQYTFSDNPTPADHIEEALKEKELFGKLPKRPPTIYALFIKEQFKLLPADMPVKEKFGKAAETWKSMSEDGKRAYKSQMSEYIHSYKEKFDQAIQGMTPEQLQELKKLKKEKVKFKTRQRIRSKLRELNYPKKPVSGYIFFIRDRLARHWPDGDYPPVRSPGHQQWMIDNAQAWRSLSDDDRKPFQDQALADKQRYYAELEHWKENLGKPENEENLLKLERLSRKMENTKKPEKVVKARQKKVAAKVIKQRLKDKGLTLKEAKKKAAAAAKKEKEAKAEAE